VIKARTLSGLLSQAADSGWTVERCHPQFTELTKGADKFAVFHASTPPVFDHAYRVNARTTDFLGAYPTLRSLVKRLNEVETRP
jgi:hypothetical protein